MASFENRPYIGSYNLNSKELVQHTPDGLVYINGDLSVPGCNKCNGRIDIQQYVTNISVDSGVDPAAASATISLGVPQHTKDHFHRNTQFILRPGLEVHIYFRGYFPIKGLYKNLTPEDTGGTDVRNLLAYPYYHVFHGVVTSVSHSIEAGFQDISLSCNSMLHFWQFHNISTNASVFGTRPANSGLRTSLVGHNFTGMTPFSIIYTLFHDTAGAAGGVAFALSSKTNVNAQSSVTDQSLWSLNIRYWEERFKQRMINLRMHGASGQLFSTAQAAFLGRLKSGEIRELLDAPFKGKIGANNTQKFDILSASRALNLLREVRDPATGEVTVQGLDVVEAARSANPSSERDEARGGYEVNVAAMQAFVNDIGQWGQVNLFESTYESKLDIVNKVLEITGWEFFQDVDGDFVFKPPMYNLDTRGSRVYVIRDIDIISLSFDEKEPEATYVTMTGSQFKNLQGTGLEGEWGVRGQYIDYKLVAQFGWRTASFETAYFNNPRSMFFAAVNRLDVVNAGTFSASCSIPIRPELRAGYPVYIEPYDCFYYLTAFSHTLSFGAQCTTSLTLTAKRAAFFPPGRPDKASSGVNPNTPVTQDVVKDRIDLGDTTLPRIPLEIADENGRPKLTGFPNVVMALDPNAINPLFFQAGLDLDDISNPQVLRNALNLAEQKQLVKITNVDGVNRITIGISDQTEQVVDTGENETPERDSRENDGQVRNTYTFEELTSLASTYVNIAMQPSTVIEEANELIAQKQNQIQSLNSERTQIIQSEQVQGSSEESSQRLQQISEEYRTLQNEIRELQGGILEERENINSQITDNPDLQMLVDLLRSLGGPTEQGTDDFRAPSRTSNLLDLISDKKAIFTNGSLPGVYRYFSSAHPDPIHQAPRRVDTTEGLGGGVDDVYETLTAFVEDEETGEVTEQPVTRRVQQFVPPTKPFVDGSLPDSEIQEREVTVGLRILQSRSTQVQSTDQIQTIAFQRHDFGYSQGQTVFRRGEFYHGLDGNGRARIRNGFPDPVSVSPTSTLAEVYTPVWNKYTTFRNGNQFTGPLPSEIPFQNETLILAETTFQQVKDAYFPLELSAVSAVAVLNNLILERLVTTLTETFRAQREAIERFGREGSPDSNPNARREQAQILRDMLSVGGGSDARFTLGERVKVETPRGEPAYSPVFPVSDEGGYEVFGSYRYGRGLQITANSSLAALYDADPLQFADQAAVEDYLDALRGITPNSLEFVDEDGNRTGGEAPNPVVSAAQQQLIESVRSNPNTPSEVITALENEDTQTSIGLRNFTARVNEGINRLPINNAAFSLGQLQSEVDIRPCSCRASEADILIEAATDNFVQVVNADADDITQTVANIIYDKGLRWAQRRDALRGSAMSPQGRGLVERFQQLGDSFRRAGQSGDAAIQDLRDSRDALRESREAFENLNGED